MGCGCVTGLVGVCVGDPAWSSQWRDVELRIVLGQVDEDVGVWSAVAVGRKLQSGACR